MTLSLIYQTKQNTTFYYLWCHGCNQPLDEGLSITALDDGRQRWMRLCPDCIDKINSYLRKELVNELATGRSYLYEGSQRSRPTS